MCVSFKTCYLLIRENTAGRTTLLTAAADKPTNDVKTLVAYGWLLAVLAFIAASMQILLFVKSQ